MLAENNLLTRSNLLGMARVSLGETGSIVSSLCYLFLHYCLLVAYISKGGELLNGAVHNLAGVDVPEQLLAALFTLGWGSLCYFASDQTLDKTNTALAGGLMISFLLLLADVFGGVTPSALFSTSDWSAVPDALPVIALAFVFQNVVPVVVDQQHGDRKRIQISIALGSLIPLLMFVLWDAAVLGQPTVAADGSIIEDPLAVLLNQSGLTGGLIQSFSLLALTTSFMGFVLGLTDFVADGMNVSKKDRKDPRNVMGRAVPFLVTLVPPYFLGLLFRDIFFEALDKAGTYGVLMLFGVLPPAMLYRLRYDKKKELPQSEGGTANTEMLGGGPSVLLATGAVSAAIIGREIFQSFRIF